MENVEIFEKSNIQFKNYIESLDLPEDEKLQMIYDYTAYQCRRSILSYFNVIFGGRGTGKTFKFLDDLIRNKDKFIWLRDNEEVVKKVAKGQSLTFQNEIKDKTGTFPHIEIVKEDDIYKFVDFKPDGSINNVYGYLMALSTFKNSRGVDFSDVDWIIFDEFIPEKSARVLKFQGDTLQNMYETVNRNRELEGREPVRLVLLANTNYIFSDILETFGVSDIIEEMTEKGNYIYKTDDIYIRFLENDAFKELKKNTLLYRLSAKDDDFNNMALENKFDIDRTFIDKKPDLKGAKPLFKISKRYTMLELKNGRLYFKRANYKGLENFNIEEMNDKLLYSDIFKKEVRKRYVIRKIRFDSIYTQKFFVDNMI